MTRFAGLFAESIFTDAERSFKNEATRVLDQARAFGVYGQKLPRGWAFGPKKSDGFTGLNFSMKVAEVMVREEKQGTLREFLLAKQTALAAQKDFARGVHLARAQSKRLIALLRLFRKEIGKAEFGIGKRRIKAAADLLAAERDRHVLRKSLCKLAPKLKRKDCREVTRWVEMNLPEPKGTRLVGPLEKARNTLAREVNEWIFDDLSDVWEPEMKRLFRKACQAFDKAEKKCSVKNLHALRKRVKTLVLNMECAETVGIEIDRELYESLDKLQKALGDVNDLASTKKFIGGRAKLEEGVSRELMGCLKKEKCGAEKKALKRGRDLFGK